MPERDPPPWRCHLAAVLKTEGELARWRRLGVRPRLWWRDDDAQAPSPALDRLLALAGQRPLALAVIPSGPLEPLAERLKGARNVSIGQHGVDHRNRRPEGVTPSEYALPPYVEEIATRVSAARERMVEAGLSPCFYTPPWNAVDSGLPQALARMGMPVLSAGETCIVRTDIAYLPAEIDVLAWKGEARFKGEMRVMSALGRALAARRRAGELHKPIGLLTHHLDHDEATWTFLEWAMPFLDRRFDWADVTASRHMEVRQDGSRPARPGIDTMARARRV